MGFNSLEEILNKYLAMQDFHREALKANIAILEKGGSGIKDLDYLTVQRNLVYKEIRNYFEKIFPGEDLSGADTKSKLSYLSEKLCFIIDRETGLKKLIVQNSKLLSAKLGRMRKGKNALNAYSRTAGITQGVL